MLVVDVVLIGVLLFALLVGRPARLLASLGALDRASMLGGVAAFWLMPIVNDVWPWQSSRVLAVIGARRVLLLVRSARRSAARSAALLRRGVDRHSAAGRSTGCSAVSLAVVAGALSLTLVSSSVGRRPERPVSRRRSRPRRCCARSTRSLRGPSPRPSPACARAVLDDGLPRLGVLLDLGRAAHVAAGRAR